MSDRREFSVACQKAIIERATEDSRIHCERCNRWCPKRADFEIDHILAEGMRPKADKQRKLVPADGQLLCTAVCHPEKTKQDKAEIGLAKRREAYTMGVETPGKRKMRTRPRRERPPYRPAPGAPRLMREGYIPAGGRR